MLIAAVDREFAIIPSSQARIKRCNMMRLTRSLAVAIALFSGAALFPPSCAAREKVASQAGQALGSPTASPPVDFFGDPLPAGALARMGTARLRGQVLTFSADSRTLVTAGADRAFHYWDVADGKERTRKQLSFVVLQGRFDVVHLLSGISANGQWYVSYDNEAIRVWETATGKELQKVPNPTFPFNGKSLSRLAVSNDGRTIAASLLDFNAKKCPLIIWNTATAKEHKIVFEEKDYAYPAFSPDGKTLVVAGHKGMMRFYDAATAKEARRIQTEPITVNPMYPIVSPDNKRVAWPDGGRKLKLWNIADGTEFACFDVPEFGRNYFLAFAGDGKRVALATEKGVLIWDTVARKELHKILRPEAQTFVGAAFSPDGKTLAVSDTGGARLYDVATGKQLIQPMGSAATRSLSLAFSPDGLTLAASSMNDPAIHIWESDTGRPVLRINVPDHNEPILYSLDAQQLVIGDRNGSIHFLNAKTGAPERKLDMNGKDDIKIKYPILRLAIDGKTLSALGSRFEGKLYSRFMVWDLATGKMVKRTDFPGAFGAMIGPNGTILHPEGRGRNILRDGLTGKQVVQLNDVTFGPFSFTRDGKRLAVASSDAATFVDLANGRTRAMIPTGKVGDLELSPDGRLLAAISRTEIVLWEIATAKPVYRVQAPAPFSAADGVAFSTRAAFSPDGRRLATGFKDTTVLVWDIAPGLQRGPRSAKVLGQKDLEQLWSDLAADDTAKAYRAIWTLASAPDQAVPFVKGRLKPASDNGKRIAKLIVDLNSEQFTTRNAALAELKKLDIEVEPAFDRAIAVGVALECKRRMQTLLDLPPAIVRTREILRGVRAVQMLEAARTPAARQLLNVLATGAADARLTKEAKEALQRSH
jgi:WD40 repeat protein